MPKLALACAAVVVPAILSVNLINSYAHVFAFPFSAKAEARRVVDRILQTSPERSITVISYPNRGPFQKRIAEPRVSYFLTMTTEYDIESWNEYLEIVEKSVRGHGSDYVVYECIIAYWPVFLPHKFASNYSKRLDYPNPGPAAWREMLSRSGYSLDQQVQASPMPPWVSWTIGEHYQNTIEGTGGSGCAVTFFKRNDAAPL